ncbi:MAG: HAMP domain-containing protein [Anaerolineae bacterium]|nr:HAMP domain-containing protein [Anaerolineae bacterium]
MSLGRKLFISYLVVILVGALVMGVSTLSIAPVTFAQHVESMRDTMTSMMMSTGMEQLELELNNNFRQAINSTLLIATAAATVAAGIVSAYVTRRIAMPIQQAVRASERIANGHYEERLPVYSEDELGDLTRSFNRMAAALAETEAVRQQLIADISHELKTPLAGIQAYMEGLLDRVMEPTPETFEQVQREAGRLQRLVHDLQELSRAESDQIKLSIVPCEATELVKATSQWIHPQFEDSGIELRLDLPDKSVTVLADHDRIRQVLLNLLGNALQYTPTGGQVMVGWELRGGAVRFFVRDTGIGLAAEDLEHIFLRFYRVDKSRARASGGSGIGLTISQAIIRAHNGRLWAESAGPGQGSTFLFTLPLAV